MNKPVTDINFWKERLANLTDDNIHHSVLKCPKNTWDTLHNIHIDIVHKHITNDDKVLDLACGYGRLSEHIHNYTGCDLSPDLIRTARDRHSDKTFVVCEHGKPLPFKDKNFDWCIIISLKEMIISNCGNEEWLFIENEIKRVSSKCLILEYGELLPESSGVHRSKAFKPSYEIMNTGGVYKHFYNEIS